MIFTGSFFRFSWYLQLILLDLHNIYRLLYAIYLIFIGFITFTWYHPYRLLHAIYMIFTGSFSIYMIFTGSLKPFTCYLQGSLYRFTCHLQVSFIHLNVCYKYQLVSLCNFRFVWQKQPHLSPRNYGLNAGQHVLDRTKVSASRRCIKATKLLRLKEKIPFSLIVEK